MRERFVGQVVVITGAASGLGLRLSELFDEAGAIVAALDINVSAMERLSEGRSSRFLTFECDLSDPDSIAETFSRILDQTNQIDILINNAGIVPGKYVEDLTREDIERTFGVNVLAHFFTVQAVLPGMKKRGSGHIVSIASAGGLVASPRLGAYAASKFAAVGLNESLRLEFRKLKLPIYTTLIAPYFMNTGMFEGVKTRFPLLLPILDPELVARRTLGAIAKRKKRLIMPWFVYSSFALRLLPVTWFDSITDFFGITRAMDDFRGRS